MLFQTRYCNSYALSYVGVQICRDFFIRIIKVILHFHYGKLMWYSDLGKTFWVWTIGTSICWFIYITYLHGMSVLPCRASRGLKLTSPLHSGYPRRSGIYIQICWLPRVVCSRIWCRGQLRRSIDLFSWLLATLRHFCRPEDPPTLTGVSDWSDIQITSDPQKMLSIFSISHSLHRNFDSFTLNFEPVWTQRAAFSV